MKTNAEFNSENSSTSSKIEDQGKVRVDSGARPLQSEATTSANAKGPASEAGTPAAGTPDEGQTNAITAQLENAFAALERRDYATAKALFEAVGRKQIAEAIGKALLALDHKDYAAAQGLFEALTLSEPPPSVGGSIASGSLPRSPQRPIIPPLENIKFTDAAYRPPPSGEKTKKRSVGRVLLRSSVVLGAVLIALAIYAPPLDLTLGNTKNATIADLASAFDLIKTRMDAITGKTARAEERSTIGKLSASLTQATFRLDQIEHDYEARLDRLSERIDQKTSSKIADIAARIDDLAKKTAVPATSAAEFANVAARLDRLEKRVLVAPASTSELADLTTRLNRLEKAASAPVVGSAKPPLPAAPTQSTQLAKAERSVSNENARPHNQKPLLRGYSVEDVQDGVAVVDSRYGSRQVAPGDFIPGAGRVLRIERRGRDWVVLTSAGVIVSGPEQ
jgi:hypothetical protein